MYNTGLLTFDETWPRSFRSALATRTKAGVTTHDILHLVVKKAELPN